MFYCQILIWSIHLTACRGGSLLDWSDKKDHTIDVRVVYKNDDVILRIKDDCVPFDPGTRSQLKDPSDPAKNIGIRMVYQIARDIQYQNMMGINVLQMRI